MEEENIGQSLLKKQYYENCPGCKADQAKDLKTDVSIRNLSYIWIVVLCGTLPVSSLFPFVYFMIKDFNIAEREEDISTYAGYVGSAFMLGRALTSILWGMISDRYGRKPVIIIGVITVVIFNTLFGLSTNLWMAISMRFFLGSLNGSLGPIKAYATEIFREEKQALGLSTVVAAWGVGLVIGPALGGYLAQPVLKYPHLFPKDSFWDKFPYFLPCFIISAFAFAAAIACIWFPVFSLWALSPRRLGGLSFTTNDVGNVLAISGIAIIIYQLTLYPSVQKTCGPVNLARITGALSIPLLQSYPFMTMLSGSTLYLVINIASVLKHIMSETIATGLFLLQNRAVEQHQRGAANGIAMTGMSAFKTIGPAGGGAILTWSQKRINASFLPGTHMVFLALNVVEGLGVLLMFKPFLSVKKKTPREQLH
ncbi:MFS transporter superfamily [Sesbania bispinosa]|nr:MFS transporter superfamily [Sesbania bispinosa]